MMPEREASGLAYIGGKVWPNPPKEDRWNYKIDFPLGNRDAEMQVIGVMAQDIEGCKLALSLLNIGDFVWETNQNIFAGLKALAEKEQFGISPFEKCFEDLKLHLYECVEHTPTKANLPYHCRLLIEYTLKRKAAALLMA